jgi:tetratricopeptide (TPR) repeat protein
MALPLLAAALIVRNESARLPGCLAALSALGPLVDHVVVHDTGSADDTVQLARTAGATVIEGSWEDDFALARNIALDGTEADWVLMVDADELLEGDPVRLGALLAGAPDADAAVVRLSALGPYGAEAYTAPIVRIVRPRRARFAGRLHERPEAIDGRPALRLLEVPGDVLTLRHLGYADPAEVRRKAERNLRLADAAVQAAASEAALARALYHRGRTLLSAGRPDEALTDLERLHALSVPVIERLWGLDVLVQLRLAPGRADDTGDLLGALIGELRELGAGEQYCNWLGARALLARERFADALELLRTVTRLVDTVGRELDLVPVVQAQLIAAGRVGAVDEAAACCIRLMAGLGRTEGLGALLLTLWGSRPAEWLAGLLAEADRGHLTAVAAELRRCDAPGPVVAAALTRPALAP